MLDAPNPVADSPDAQPMPAEAPTGHLAFHDVSFRYPAADEASVASLETDATPNEPGRIVLDGSDLTVGPGQMLAIVGPSGSGKSTLASLVPRLYDVTDGSVTLDGHDLRTLFQEELRARIGVVTQDPHLFHDTVGANLRYARPEATDADLDEACRAARILDVVRRLPDGYETVVGERGHRLSGG